MFYRKRLIIYISFWLDKSWTIKSYMSKLARRSRNVVTKLVDKSLILLNKWLRQEKENIGMTGQLLVEGSEVERRRRNSTNQIVISKFTILLKL